MASLVIGAAIVLVKRMLPLFLRRLIGENPVPTLLHLTHAKAGSTWIAAVLHELFGEKLAPRGRRVAESSGGELGRHVFETGRVYPAMFMTREEVLSHPELNGCKRFVVIRDLRDTLVALFYSLKLAGPGENSAASRGEMDPIFSDDEEAGLLQVLDSRIAQIAEIQTSWFKQGEVILRYEDLIDSGFHVLRDAFIHRLGLPVSEKKLHRAIQCAPGERSAQAVRQRGRRGGAVQWRNHFTPKVRARFAEKFGHVLIAAGYEKDLAWSRDPSSTHSTAGL